MSYRAEIKERLDDEQQYRRLLFPRAYLLTDASWNHMNQYPFYQEWDVQQLGRFNLLVHTPAKAYSYLGKDCCAALVGHAYNPFSRETDEKVIIHNLVSAITESESAFYDLLDQLTGVFAVIIIRDEEIIAVQDCGGQKMLYFGEVGNSIVISSSPQLVDDVFGLTPNTESMELLRSKGYRRGSGFLPGNLSPYKEIKRLGANTIVRYKNGAFKIERFFPRERLDVIQTEQQKEETVEEMYRIMSTNIALAMRKWPRVALSLTGGTDSKTTLACASDFYDKLHIYSFISKKSEKLDADAAKEICRVLKLKHHLYQIPEMSDGVGDYTFLQKIIEHNTSYSCKIHPNEKRKYIWMANLNDFDVEIKSDISEIGRAYTTRKYLNVSMPRKLAPRHLTIGQGRYFLEPRCFRLADDAYEIFMRESSLVSDMNGYSMHDLCYWEVRMGSWAATSFASQEIMHETTIPYNNRNLMKLFLRFPEEDRLRDIPHKYLMQYGNKELARLEISIKDSYFDKKRMYLETIYYYYATRLNTYRSKL